MGGADVGRKRAGPGAGDPAADDHAEGRLRATRIPAGVAVGLGVRVSVAAAGEAETAAIGEASGEDEDAASRRAATTASRFSASRRATSAAIFASMSSFCCFKRPRMLADAASRVLVYRDEYGCCCAVACRM